MSSKKLTLPCNIESSAEAQKLIAQCAMWCRMTGHGCLAGPGLGRQVLFESIALGRDFKDLPGWRRRVIAGLEDDHA